MRHSWWKVILSWWKVILSWWETFVWTNPRLPWNGRGTRAYPTDVRIQRWLACWWSWKRYALTTKPREAVIHWLACHGFHKKGRRCSGCGDNETKYLAYYAYMRWYICPNCCCGEIGYDLSCHVMDPNDEEGLPTWAEHRRLMKTMEKAAS